LKSSNSPMTVVIITNISTLLRRVVSSEEGKPGLCNKIILGYVDNCNFIFGRASINNYFINFRVSCKSH